MFKSKTQAQMIAKNPFSSTDGTAASDSESDLLHELEQKKSQLDYEVATFQAQKEKEFRDFEQHIRLSRRHKARDSISRTIRSEKSPSQERPPRSSSSSALDLLAGHGSTHSGLTSGCSSKAHRSQKSKRGSLSPKPGPASSKPTLSLEPLNIKGETCPSPQIKSPSTPTLLSRSLSRSSSTSSAETSTQPLEAQPSTPQSAHAETPKSRKEEDKSFTGVLTPSYLPLLDSHSHYDSSSSSALITPPADDLADDPGRAMLQLPNGIIPVLSSSFPPHQTTLSTSSTTAKRAYTAPTTTRKPSALRSASASNLARKRKHVTFRLADSAIVDPSSSYEEGPSPLDESERPRSKSASAMSHSSKNPSTLRYSNAGTRNGLIGDHSRSDEEDEAAGVKPGMSMDEVMQKLNEFNSIHGNNDDVNFSYEDEEDVGWTDTKYHEDDEDEEEDEGEEQDEQDETDEEDSKTGQNQLDLDSDSYFSPKSGEMSSMPTDRFREGDDKPRFRDRTGSSPLIPVRDHDWDSLSSSDKDRLLFSRRLSDESDHDRPHEKGRSGRQLSRSVNDRASSSNSSLSGLKKTNSTNSLSSLTALNKLTGNSSKTSATPLPLRSGLSKQNKFENGLQRSIDGGSGVGFFELDEELASPHAGKVDPFVLDIEDNIDDLKYKEDDEHEIDDLIPSLEASLSGDTLKSTFVGASSVPITIVRPSASVSSSWVGTFGH